MLPSCPPTPEGADVVIEAGQLVDALLAGHGVIWIEAGGTSPVVGTSIRVERDVTLCGAVGTRIALQPDFVVAEGAALRLERLVLQADGDAAVHVLDGAAALHDCELVKGRSGTYGLWLDPGTTGTVIDTRARGWVGPYAAPFVSSGDLTLIGGLFEDNTSGVVRAISLADSPPASTAILGGTYTRNGSWFRRGGAIAQFGGTLTVSDVTFAGAHVGRLGGALYAELATVELSGVIVDAGAGGLGGALYARGGEVGIRGGAMTGWAEQGGAIYVEDNRLTLRDVTVKDSWAEERGGGLASIRSTVTVTGLQATDNEAPLGANWYSRRDDEWHVAFSELCDPVEGPSVVLDQPTEASLTFSSLLGGSGIHLRRLGDGPVRVQNVTVQDGVVGLDLGDGLADVRNTLFSRLSGGAILGGAVDGGHNLVHRAEILAGGGVSDELIQGDPQLGPGQGACGRDLLPGPDSPARRAGDPSLPGEDGRPLDIGAFQVDDGDVDPPEGCEPRPEIADDGIDQDCDGFDASSWVRGGACDTGGAGGSWLAALWVALARGRGGSSSR